MRLRLCLAVAVVAAFAAFGAGSASADVTPTANAVFESNVPGAHGDYTITHGYTYSGVPSGVPSTTGDDLKQWIVDSPAGLVGNPNAVPEADRCDAAAFDAAMAAPNATSWVGVCPGYTSSPAEVGQATLNLGIDANGAAAASLGGVIFLLSGTPEVPTRLGTIFPTSAPGGMTATYSVSTIGPVPSGPEGDYRLRTVSDAPINRPIVAAGPTYGNISGIVQQLYGHVNDDPNKPAFLTNPVRCDDWNSYIYAQSYGDVGGTANQTFTPMGTLTNGGDVEPGTFAVATSTPTTPNCGTTPPLNSSVTTTLNTTDRAANPQLDIVVNNPTAPGTDVPKNMVITLPGAIAADIDAIAVEKLCTVAQRDTNSCPASSKVGTVKVETPMIVAGLTGNVHLIKKDEGGLPNLAIFVTGAIEFRLDATTQYVGPEGAQIESTLTNLPQVPFTKFTVTIDGGKPDALLVYRECKTDGSAPVGGMGGAITSATTGYTGASNASSTEAKVSGCYGTPKIKSPKKCVRYKLAVTPRNMLNSPGISKIELYVGKTKRSQRTRLTKDTKAPWKLQKRLGNKFKRGKTYYMYVKTTYKPTVDAPSGKVLKSKVAKFKRCR